MFGHNSDCWNIVHCLQLNKAVFIQFQMLSSAVCCYSSVVGQERANGVLVSSLGSAAFQQFWWAVTRRAKDFHKYRGTANQLFIRLSYVVCWKNCQCYLLIVTYFDKCRNLILELMGELQEHQQQPIQICAGQLILSHYFHTCTCRINQKVIKEMYFKLTVGNDWL
jgi:hypothetical protein